MMGRTLLVLTVAVAVIVPFFNGAIAIKCYGQPAGDPMDLQNAKTEAEIKKVMQNAKDTMKSGDCPFQCFVATKCNSAALELLGLKDQDIRGCFIDDICKKVSWDPSIAMLFGGKTGNQACPRGCNMCNTDYCNGPPQNPEKGLGPAGGGEANFGSSLGSPPIALLAVAICIVVGATLKMWML